MNPIEGAAAFDLKCVGGDWIIEELSLESIEVSSKTQNSEDNEVNIEEIEAEDRSEVEVRQKRKCSKSGWRGKDFLFQIDYMGKWNCSQKNFLDYEDDNDVDILCKFSNNRSPTVSQEIIIDTTIYGFGFRISSCEVLSGCRNQICGSINECKCENMSA